MSKIFIYANLSEDQLQQILAERQSDWSRKISLAITTQIAQEDINIYLQKQLLPGLLKKP